MWLNTVTLAQILPCIADAEKRRFIARFDRDVAEILPYLNAILNGAIYNPTAKTLTLMKDGRLITIHSCELAAGKVLDEEDAYAVMAWVKDNINYCARHREEITPDHTMRQQLGYLQVFELLPLTNCGACGELSCLAFAVMLVNKETTLDRCPALFLDEYTAQREVLIELLEDAGYRIIGDESKMSDP